MKTICGINCNECSMKEECKGCLNTNGHPFGGDCVLATCSFKKEENSLELINKYKEELIKEFNALKIKDMPLVTELYSLKGSFINMEYELNNGTKIKLLKDNNIYLGNQLPKKNSKRCYGIAADNEYLLVSEYSQNGINSEIIIYKKRKR